MNKEFWDAIDKLVSTSAVVIDRPKASAHPRYPEMIYPVDYGYLNNTASMDGDGIDVWVGTESDRRVDGLICIVDLGKRDSEIKILLGCSEAEKEDILQFHNGTEFMKGIMIRRA